MRIFSLQFLSHELVHTIPAKIIMWSSHKVSTCLSIFQKKKREKAKQNKKVLCNAVLQCTPKVREGGFSPVPSSFSLAPRVTYEVPREKEIGG